MKYYTLEIYDNDSYLLEVSKMDRDKYTTCNDCKLILNKRDLIESQLQNFNIKNKKYHMSGTYDGFDIVSKAFKDVYESFKWEGLIFYPIPKNKDFYLVECMKFVDINRAKSGVLLEDECVGCKIYMGAYLKGFVSLNYDVIQKMNYHTFYRSNLEFGYDFEQRYILFVSEEITRILKEHNIIIDKDLTEVKVSTSK